MDSSRFRSESSYRARSRCHFWCVPRASENSPAIHGWVHGWPTAPVPAGTAETFFRPGRDLMVAGRKHLSLERLGYFHNPAAGFVPCFLHGFNFASGCFSVRTSHHRIFQRPAKAPEDGRSPRRSARFGCGRITRQRLGLRRPSAARLRASSGYILSVARSKTTSQRPGRAHSANISSKNLFGFNHRRPFTFSQPDCRSNRNFCVFNSTCSFTVYYATFSDNAPPGSLPKTRFFAIFDPKSIS